MKKLWIVPAFLILSFSFALFSCKTPCCSKPVHDVNQLDDKAMNDDSTKYVILASESNASVFFKDSKLAVLSSDEISQVIKLVGEAVQNHNNHESTRAVSAESLQIIEFDKYRMQFVPVFLKKEKVVLVNCFCDPMISNWRTNLVLVKDGGKCFFTVKINLAKKTYYDLFLNGMG